MKKKNILNILIIDDHLLVRDGLKNILKSIVTIYDLNVFEASNLTTAMRVMKLKKIDLVFLDYQLENETGAEIMPFLFELNKELKVVTLSNYDELQFVKSMLKLGAVGYLIKNISKQQLTDCILMVMNNQKYFSTEILIKLLQEETDQITSSQKIKSILTKREMQILLLISMELTNEEMAEKLGLSRRTIDNHRQNLLVKLGVKNTAGLIKYAYKNNFI